MENRKNIKNRKLGLITKYMNVKIFHLLISKIFKRFSKNKKNELKQH